MLTRPIPNKAESVVKKIQHDVPRPKYLPSPKSDNGNYLRWETDLKRCCSRPLHYGLPALFCPMGLLPNALCSSPANKDDFLECTFDNYAIRAFTKWWDEQKDVRAAVKAVWGENGKQKV